MQQYDKIEAVFAPRDLSTLKADAQAFIGKRGTFEVLWRIEAGSKYSGEWAMKIPPDWKLPTGRPFDELFFWVPSGDLRLNCLIGGDSLTPACHQQLP